MLMSAGPTDVPLIPTKATLARTTSSKRKVPPITERGRWDTDSLDDGALTDHEGSQDSMLDGTDEVRTGDGGRGRATGDGRRATGDGRRATGDGRRGRRGAVTTWRRLPVATARNIAVWVLNQNLTHAAVV